MSFWYNYILYFILIKSLLLCNKNTEHNTKLIKYDK